MEKPIKVKTINPSSVLWREAVAERAQDSLDHEFQTSRMKQDYYDEQSDEIACFLEAGSNVSISDDLYSRIMSVIN